MVLLLCYYCKKYEGFSLINQTTFGRQNSRGGSYSININIMTLVSITHLYYSSYYIYMNYQNNMASWYLI